jgi:hypothetical protein
MVAFVPGRVRFLPRIIPVVSMIKTMAHRALTSHAGELFTAVSGSATASTPNSGGPVPLLPPRANRRHSSLILWLRITHTPSVGILLKKPLVICYLNPPSLAYSRNTHSHFEDVVSPV